MDYRAFPTPKGQGRDDGPRRFGRREEIKRDRAARAASRARLAKIVALALGAAVLGYLVIEAI